MNRKNKTLFGILFSTLALTVGVITFGGSKKKIAKQYEGMILPEVGNPLELGYAEPAYSAKLPNSLTYNSNPSSTETGNFTNYIGLLNFGDMRNHYRGDTVKVAVIDSGCNYTHQDFILNNKCILSEDSASFLVSGSSVITTRVKNGGTVDFSVIDDDNTTHDGHGTAVCGTIVGQINSLSSMGVAPNVELVVCKTNYNFGEIQTAINYCITHDVDIINLSVQSYVNTVTYNSQTSTGLGSGLPEYLKDHINSAYSHGITVIAAGGNYNTSEKSYPANNDHVLAVGALAEGSKTSKAAYSNTGTNVSVVGPGTVRTASATYDNSTRTINGTSFAAPAVAGVAALYKQQNPDASPDQVMNAIRNTCTPLKDTNYFGNGAVNVDWLLTPIEDITLSPSSISLDINESKTISVSSISPSNACTNMMYISDDESIAYADIETGSIKGIGAGSTIIYAQSLKDNNFSYEIPVTVTDSTIHVNSISLNSDYSGEQQILVGSKVSIKDKFTVYPTNATNKNVTYSLNVDDGTLSVSNDGLVTALKEGTEIVTITSVDNPDASTDIYFEVGAAEQTKSVSISYSDFSAGTSGTGSASSAQNDPITISVAKGYKASDEERSYAGGSITISGDNLEIRKIVIHHHGGFTKDQSISLSTNGYSVSSSNSGGVYLYTIEGSGSNSVTFTNSKQLKFTSVDIEYVLSTGGSTEEKTLLSLSVSNSHRSFVVGDSFVKETVTANYSDNSTATVTNEAIFTGYDMNAEGNQTVCVTYTDSFGTADTEYSIVVSAPQVTNYTVTFDSNGGTGTMSSKQTSGSTYVVPECSFTRSGYTFDKWALNSTSGTKYSVGATINNITSNIILYATWKENGGQGVQMPSDYYDTISNSLSGNELLTKLRTLNLDKRKSTVGYSSMGTDPSGYYKYTDYDPKYVQYNSDGQPYGTQILSFYSGISCDSWNREHVWPNSRGGGSGGSAGDPHPDADIFMPRPTISAENSNRGNSKYVENVVSTTAGWDPVAAFGSTIGVYPGIRGECARIIFYCMTVNANLVLDDTATGGTTGVTMGKLSDLLKWNRDNPVNDREIRRQSGGQYLQKNRNAFVDHPEYACKIWGNYNDATREICGGSSEHVSVTGVELNKKTLNLSAGNSETLTANISPNNASNNSVTWTSSDESVATVSSTGLVRAKKAGTTIITVETNEGHFTDACLVTVTGVSTAKIYKKVTSNQSDWSGEYLLIHESSGSSSAWDGNDTGGGEASVSISNSECEKPDNAATLTINKFNSGYSIKVNSDTSANDGKYISGTSGNNIVKFDQTASANTITYESNSTKITSNTSVMRYNSSTKQFRYYKSTSYSSQQVVQLYKLEESVIPKVNSISLDEKSLDLDLNGLKTSSLTATIDADVGADYDIEWSSSDPSVATVSGNGNTATVTAVGEGNAEITVKAGGEQATCSVTVTDSSPVAVTGVSLDTTSTSISVGSTITLTATVTPTNASNKNVSWSTSDSSVATVSNGTVTALAVGNATITVKTEDGDYTAACALTVTSAPVITYQLEADKTTIPYMSGTDHNVSIGVKLYQYTNGIKGNEVASGTGNVDTSSLGAKNVTYTYQSITYTTQVTITNKDADVGISEESHEEVTYSDASSLISFNKDDAVKTGSGSIIGTKQGSTKNNIEFAVSRTGTYEGYNGGDNSFHKIGTKSAPTHNLTLTSTTSVSNVSSFEFMAGYYIAATDIKVTIGNDVVYTGKTAKSSGIAKITANLSRAYSGIVKIEFYSSTGRTLLQSIKMFYQEGTTTTVEGESHNATPLQQANAWADYFIRETRTLDTCLASTNAAKLSGLKIKWAELANEYELMVSGAKDEFCTSTDSRIVEAREHYKYIVSKFGASNLGTKGNFVTNGQGTALNTNTTNRFSIVKLDNQTTLIVVISLISVTSLGLYFYLKRKKEIE